MATLSIGTAIFASHGDFETPKWLIARSELELRRGRFNEAATFALKATAAGSGLITGDTVFAYRLAVIAQLHLSNFDAAVTFARQMLKAARSLSPGHAYAAIEASAVIAARLAKTVPAAMLFGFAEARWKALDPAASIDSRAPKAKESFFEYLGDQLPHNTLDTLMATGASMSDEEAFATALTISVGQNSPVT